MTANPLSKKTRNFGFDSLLLRTASWRLRGSTRKTPAYTAKSHYSSIAGIADRRIYANSTVVNGYLKIEAKEHEVRSVKAVQRMFSFAERRMVQAWVQQHLKNGRRKLFE